MSTVATKIETWTTKGRKRLYWVTTISAALACAAVGAADLVRIPQIVEGLEHLGYPAYIATILGAWQLLGSATIVVPRLRRLKEWAYAGMFFTLSGAAMSHAAVGEPLNKILLPVVLLVAVMTSWRLQPARGNGIRRFAKTQPGAGWMLRDNPRHGQGAASSLMHES